MKKGYKISIYGEIPEEWHIVELGEYVNIKSGESPSLFELAEEGTTPYLKVEDLNNSTKYQNLSRNYINSNFNHAPKGSIIFPKRGASILLNKIRISKREVLMDSNLMAIFPKDNRLDSEFLFYLINSINLSRIADTSSIPQINNKHITPLKVVYPPLPEQQKIADILTTLDDKLENIESQIAEYTTLKTGLMQQLLTKGIGHTNFVESELGMIPEGWRVVKLGEIGSIYNGLSGKSKDDFGNGEPYIPYMNIFSNNTINPNWLEYVSISPDENQNAVKYGDVFFTTSSETPEEVGMSSVLLDDIGTAYLNSFCFGFRLNDFNALLPDYAKFLFRGQAVRKSIVVFAQGSTRFNLSKTNLLKRLHLALPPISEQKEIANILTSVDEKMKSLLQKKEEYTKLKKGLMEQLLTGRIRVKV